MKYSILVWVVVLMVLGGIAYADDMDCEQILKMSYNQNKFLGDSVIVAAQHNFYLCRIANALEKIAEQ